MPVIGRLDQYASMLAYEFDDYSMSENLLLYSEQFNNAYWSKNNITVSANATTAPDGTLTADNLSNTPNQLSYCYPTSGNSGLSATTSYTASVYVKPLTTNKIITFVWGNDGSTKNFDLSTLSISGGGSPSNGGGGGPGTITVLNDGWYRISNTTLGYTKFDGFYIGAYGTTVDSVTVAFWGAQLEAGLVATDYTPTTTTAINRVLASTTNTNITGLGTYYSSGLYENVGFTTFLSANVFSPYDPVYDEFSGTSFGAGQGRYMRQNTDNSVIVYNEIDEITPIETTIPTTGLQLNIDPGVSTSTILGVGQESYTTAGTYTFTVPAGVTSLSAVVIGGGGGGGGADNSQLRTETNNGGGGGGLAYGTISVTPGENLIITVGSGGTGGSSIDENDGNDGGTSTIVRSATTLLSGGGGVGGIYRSGGGNISAGGASGGTLRIGGGSGGTSGTGSNNSGATGGGGAGGYSGNGGAGGNYNTAGSNGAGGGGGGGGGRSGTSLNFLAGGGGGTGILGSGSNGSGGTSLIGGGGSGGSGGGSGSTGAVGGTGAGGSYGGGGGGKAEETTGVTVPGGNGTNGAVRILWGTGRSYPSTSVADATSFSLTDLSGNGRTASSATGTYRNASGVIVYDGINDYTTVASYKGVTGTAARTSIIWFKSILANNYVRLFGWGDTIAAGNKWSVSVDSTTYKLRVELSGGAFVLGGSTTPNLTDGRWHFIAASAPASGTCNDIKLYVDGDLLTDVSRGLSATAINTASGSDVSFGASLADGSPQYLTGYTSQFLIYNTQLTDFEIKGIYRTIVYRF